MAYRLKVAVLRGGPSSEYEVSLKSGATVLKHLPEEYEAHDVFIDRAGVWHHRGVPVLPADAANRFDVFFNALHGEYGEDGKLQRLLDTLGARYTGSRALASEIAMNKLDAKEALRRHGVKVPAHVVVLRGDDLHEKALQIWRTFPQPCVVKPAGLGSSVGLTLVRSFAELVPALERALAGSHAAVVEEYIRGREATVGVVQGLREKNAHALPPVEIRLPPESVIFDYDAKYGGKTQEICPGDFADSEHAELKELATLAHEALGLRHYSRSDFIVTPRRGIYYLETNTLPGLTGESLLPKALAAEGMPLADFIRHIVELARHGR